MGKKAEGKVQLISQEKPEAAPPVAAPALKRVAIVGCSDSKTGAPYLDKTWDLWAMNNAFVHVSRATAWFEVHPIKKTKNGFLRRKLIKPGIFEWAPDFRGQNMQEYIQALASLKIPVYMQRHWDEIPMSIEYPLQSIIGKYGRYFTNSVSYMIALAIDQGYKEIGCWGVDMATGSEYGPQRPSCEYFLGIAVGLGIKVTVPDTADLLKAKFLYGFEEREQALWEKKITAMITSLDQRRAKAVQQHDMLEKQVNQYTGAIESLRESERIWSNHADPKIWNDTF